MGSRACLWLLLPSTACTPAATVIPPAPNSLHAQEAGLNCPPHSSATISEGEPEPAEVALEESDRVPLPAGHVALRDRGVWLDPPAPDYPRLLPFASQAEAEAALATDALLDAVTLPAIEVEDEWYAPGPFLAVLAAHCADERPDHLCVDLVVRGRRLALAYGGAEQALPSFGFALPSDAVSISPIAVVGLPAWRVRVDLPLPWQPWPQCWIGQLQIRVEDPRADDSRTIESRSYLEFGKCE